MGARGEGLLLLLDRRLGALRQAQPDLVATLDLQAQLLRASLLVPHPPEAQAFPLPREHLLARVQTGVPLLHDQPAQVDVHFAAELFGRLLQVLRERADGDVQARLDPLVAAASSGGLDPQRLFGEGFVQHRDHLREMAVQVGVDPRLLATLACLATAPLLRAYAERLLPMLERLDTGTPDGAVWQRGYCPVCGAWPLLGERRGVEGAEYLRCSACGSGWRWTCLACPYCANDDERSLGELTLAGAPARRLAVCERCKGYVKVHDLAEPTPPELLVLEESSTRGLDALALEHGYARPSGSGFSLELAVPDEEWLEELA